MKKIRIGNDFVFNWAIERGGLPEDLSSVLEAKLTASVFGKKQEVPFTVSENIITIEFTPEICNVIGSYNLLFTYILPDLTLSDEDRKCAVDVDAFQIVAKTAQADDSTEFSMTSDMAIAFKGDKGDSAYQVWLDAGNTGAEEDYFAYLRQPAVEAGASISELEGEIQVNEGLRVEAENERVQAFAQMIGEADDKIEEMDTTLSTYDGRVTQVESDISQLADDASVKIANLIVNGNFSNGSAGWSILGSPNTITITDKLTFNGTAGIAAGYYQDLAATTGDKLYIAVKSTNAGTVFPGVRIYDYNTTNNSEATGINNTVSSTIVNSKINGVRLYFQQINGSVYNNVTIDDIRVINLTATFGSGNEPTKEEVDLLISILGVNYFEGQVTIPAQKVMQWQLKMIRQNRSAIIALGGTII